MAGIDSWLLSRVRFPGALLDAEPFVTLDHASYSLRKIAVEWRDGDDFTAEFTVGEASFVSVLTKQERYVAGVFYNRLTDCPTS